MNPRPLLTTVLTALLLASGFSTAAAEGKAYPIKLERPIQVGQRFKLSVKESKKEVMVITKNGQILQTKSKVFQVDFAGEITVLKVDKKGEILSQSVIIEKLINKDKKDLLFKGQVVIAETIEGKTIYSVKGGKLSEEARRALAEIIKTKTKNTPGDDAVFGSKKPRRIGESWPVNQKFMAKELKIPESTVQGTVKLEKLEKSEGIECLRLVMTIKMRAFPNAKKITDGGFRVENPVITMEMTGLFPTDLKTGVIQQKMSMNMRAVLVGTKPQTKGLVLKMSVVAKSEHTQPFLK
ncbi:MAG: hypothetical protein IID45_00780 [Planctomycetes bacterium]|nr:hypothetical protein [Planctomycetota bacterium]